jgi:hypothetical protein
VTLSPVEQLPIGTFDRTLLAPLTNAHGGKGT